MIKLGHTCFLPSLNCSSIAPLPSSSKGEETRPQQEERKNRWKENIIDGSNVLHTSSLSPDKIPTGISGNWCIGWCCHFPYWLKTRGSKLSRSIERTNSFCQVCHTGQDKKKNCEWSILICYKHKIIKILKIYRGETYTTSLLIKKSTKC